MEKIFRRFINKVILHSENTYDQDVRSQYGLLGGWISIVINLVLTMLKGSIGVVIGSIALIADGVHSLSDVVTSAIVVVSFKWAKKPSDMSHPFGHGRFEAIATLIVAVLLMVLGLEFLKTSIGRMIRPISYEINLWIAGFVICTIIVKELLARFTMVLSHMIQSSALKADSWHHRTDALSSFLVLVAFGGQYIKFPMLDGIAGIFISFFICWTGWYIARDGIDDLLGKRPSDELVQKIKQAVRECPEVLDMHDLIIHQYGQQMVLSLHIQVSEMFSLKEAHSISERVERKILDKFGAHATIHLDPVNMMDPEHNRIRKYVQDLLNRCAFSAEYHDLRVVEEETGRIVMFDLVIESSIKDDQIMTLKESLEKSILNTFASIDKIQIKVEPKYAL